MEIFRDILPEFHLCHIAYTSHLVHVAGTWAVWDMCDLNCSSSCHLALNPFLSVIQENSEWSGAGTVLLHMNKCFATKAESYFRLLELSIATQLFFPFPHPGRMSSCSTSDKRQHWVALKRSSFRSPVTVLSSSDCLYQVLQKTSHKWL